MHRLKGLWSKRLMKKGHAIWRNEGEVDHVTSVCRVAWAGRRKVHGQVSRDIQHLSVCSICSHYVDCNLSAEHGSVSCFPVLADPRMESRSSIAKSICIEIFWPKCHLTKSRDYVLKVTLAPSSQWIFGLLRIGGAGNETWWSRDMGSRAEQSCSITKDERLRKYYSSPIQEDMCQEWIKINQIYSPYEFYCAGSTN